MGGKVRGLKFNQLSLEVFSKKIDYVNAAVNSTIYATFYAGLLGNCYVKGEEAYFTFEQVTDWVDELYENNKKAEIERVCKVWAETNVYRTWLKEFQDRLRAVLEPEKKPAKKKAK